MEILQAVCQLVVGLGILNVWLLRFNKATPYRGRQAGNLKEEFAAYGLPKWAIYVVGAVKLPAAVALLVGLAIPALVVPAASVLAVLMLGAIIMHFKVQDAGQKFLPASLVLLLCLVIIFI
ncbi:MAG: DoxX family protein [Puniceicoccaceae bacterium]|nr:MAG: DoxX family protein [Puniceicoccaceae bacterium]